MAKKKEPQVYRNYRFVDRDPALDRLQTLVQDSGMSYGDLSKESDVSSTTYRSWFPKGNRRGTRKPFHCTVMSTYRALGVDLTEKPYTLRKRNGNKE